MSSIKNKNHLYEEDRPRFVIIGVGGSGCNTIYRMYQEANDFFKFDTINHGGDNKNLHHGVKILGLNTDQQSLKSISNGTYIETIQLGLDGLGAGSNPENGRIAAEHNAAEIQATIEDADIVIIVAGFGGGTGTGAAPFIAELAKKMGKLVLGFITKPFFFEGIKKLQTAQNGLKLFVAKADTTIVLSNQLLFSVTNSNTSLSDAYLMIDKVSIELVKSLVRMLKFADLMNLDFADFKKATQNPEEGGLGVVGFGEATGVECGKRAVEMALSVPLFEPINTDNTKTELHGASHILIHIVSEGAPITLSALEGIVTSLTKGTHKEVSIKVGVTVLENSNNKQNDSFLNITEPSEQKIKIVFIATGFKNNIAEDNNLRYTNKYETTTETHHVDLQQEFKIDDNTSFLTNRTNINMQEETNKNSKEMEKEQIDHKEQKNNKKSGYRSLLDVIKTRFNVH